MEVKLNYKHVESLKRMKGKFLLKGGTIYIIEDFKISGKRKKNLFGVSRMELFLEDLKIKAFRKIGRELHHLSPEMCVTFLLHENLYALRGDWLALESNLRAYGWKLTKKNKLKEV